MFDQDNNEGSETGFGLGTYVGGILCFLAWGALFFLAAYIAVLLMTTVGILVYWAVRRVLLMRRLYRLEARRIPAHQGRVTPLVARIPLHR